MAIKLIAQFDLNLIEFASCENLDQALEVAGDYLDGKFDDGIGHIMAIDTDTATLHYLNVPAADGWILPDRL